MSESLGQAVELLAAGDWKKAHEIVQKEKSTLAAWIHGIVHILEGDLDNARGWYKRAEREFPGANAAADRNRRGAPGRRERCIVWAIRGPNPRIIGARCAGGRP